MKKIAVILSGCGVYDGAEVQESVLTLLALDREGAQVSSFAPSVAQAHVINHLTGEVDLASKRNVLEESARVVRGKIQDVAELQSTEFDAVIFPGGFGAAKNLCTFAFDAQDCKILPEITQVLQAFHEEKKPIGLICITPVMGAKMFQAEVTIGSDENVASAIGKMGGTNMVCPASGIHIDEKHNIVSTPAYMLDAPISEVAVGIEKLVQAVLQRTP